ncbi:MAG: hypothetical protein NTW49_00995 [Bacteroidia bacterium]|nr:hypothetical protein [Bacteroidia bacterium]
MAGEEIIDHFPVSEVIPPFLFNCWKHHRYFIRKQIEILSSLNEPAIRLLQKSLLLIGDSQMDMYTGYLDISNIIQELTDRLFSARADTEDRYYEWLQSGGDNYRIITISDGSGWALLRGNINSCYIHIHPAKHSLYTIRVRAKELKTAITALVWSNITDGSPYNIQTINKARKEVLSEPPIKSISMNEGIGKLITILSE